MSAARWRALLCDGEHEDRLDRVDQVELHGLVGEVALERAADHGERLGLRRRHVEPAVELAEEGRI